MFKLKRVWAFVLSHFSPIFFLQNMAKHLIVGYFQQREERHENNIDVKLCVVLTTTRACNWITDLLFSVFISTVLLAFQLWRPSPTLRDFQKGLFSSGVFLGVAVFIRKSLYYLRNATRANEQTNFRKRNRELTMWVDSLSIASRPKKALKKLKKEVLFQLHSHCFLTSSFIYN